MIARLVYIFITGLIILSPGVVAQDVERIVSDNALTSVLITGVRADTGATVQGSGCCVDSSGLVLATAHQVVGVKEHKGRLENGLSFTLQVVAVQADKELALLQADRPLPRAVRIGDAGTLRSGSPLVSISAPVSLEFSTVSGIVSSMHRTLGGLPVIQTNLPATHGSSGGPVFDKNGALVGITILRLNEERWVTFINPINNAYPLLAKHGVRRQEQKAAEEEELLIPAPGITETELRAVEAYNRGVRATREADKAQAYQVAVQLLPEFFEAWFNLAVTVEQLGDVQQAHEAYRTASRLRPDSLVVYRNQGRLLLRSRRVEEAVACFERARMLAPKQAQSYNDLGEAYRQAARLQEAMKTFEVALQLKPDYPAAHYNLGITLANMGQQAQAVRHLEQYLTLTPDAKDREEVLEWVAQLKGAQ